jgi:4-hydroxybenzoate polyprenyltransferase
MSLRKTLTAWGRLLRLPNLLTVPGDPLVGFVIVARAGFSWANPALWAAMGASVLLYAAGLIHNDLCDLKEDRRDRPNRPLACGAISKRSATAATVFLIAAALGLVYFYSPATSTDSLKVAICLIAAIVAYNAWLKRWVVPGALAMGACRGLSVLLGAVMVVGHRGESFCEDPMCHPDTVIAFGIWVLYIAAVTILASRETKEQRLTASRFLPVLPLLFGACLLVGVLVEEYSSYGTTTWFWWHVPGTVVWLLATVNAASPIWKLRGIAQPADIQRMIGRLIRNLLLMQAALLFAAGHYEVGAVFLILHPIHARLAKRFYAS